jgi:hypothetical protein
MKTIEFIQNIQDTGEAWKLLEQKAAAEGFTRPIKVDFDIWEDAQGRTVYESKVRQAGTKKYLHLILRAANNLSNKQ